MVDVCYDRAMNKLKGDDANGVPGRSNLISLIEWVLEKKFWICY